MPAAKLIFPPEHRYTQLYLLCLCFVLTECLFSSQSNQNIQIQLGWSLSHKWSPLPDYVLGLSIGMYCQTDHEVELHFWPMQKSLNVKSKFLQTIKTIENVNWTISYRIPCKGYSIPNQTAKFIRTKTKGLTTTVTATGGINPTGGLSIAGTLSNAQTIENLNDQV